MRKYSLVIGVAALAAMVAPASAAVDWTTWNPGTYNPGGDPAHLSGGSMSGIAGGVGVSYTGQLWSFQNTPGAAGPSWTPVSSYTNPLTAVTNAPTVPQGALVLTGGAGTPVDTITFSKPVFDPVMAIWSLGQEPPNADISASFNFINAPFTIVAGGPSLEYGGQSITANGDTVYGAEGNGVIQFTGGWVSSISWTTPVNEVYYDFTVAAVPEPATWAMFLLGFFGIGFMVRGARRKNAVAIA
jgi:hypothetical protein